MQGLLKSLAQSLSTLAFYSLESLVTICKLPLALREYYRSVRWRFAHAGGPAFGRTLTESDIHSWGDPNLHVGLRSQYGKTMHTTDKHKPVGYIFRAWITVKGEKRWARDYGLKAWRIPLYR